MRNSEGRWKCLLCPNRPFEHLSKAAAHEDSHSHVAAVRALDQQPLPSPSLLSQPECDHENQFTSTANTPAVLLTSPPHPRPRPHPRTPEPNLNTRDLLTPSYQSLQVVHGPSLPDDDEDQIYDDWAGELLFRTSHKTILRNVNHPQCPTSC
ncbi:hypothetical protein NEOLEDRAFT_1141826 [Neolentinus lepideus HHB14362 ss-1]|uniref:Uncharacterized protein n=1 Tax=Neolentinus lepideus HHB14362 ss-1 TaxID=1314782 RepID=A0A165NI20_9AGAM|nr:hypothetical protein NEOLEDRAFT_1141826 [Neolentinus lepideus HHB14362 ss-1]